jgi:hypothetical protein
MESVWWTTLASSAFNANAAACAVDTGLFASDVLLTLPRPDMLGVRATFPAPSGLTPEMVFTVPEPPPPGRTRFNTWFGAVPVIVAAAVPVVTVPMDRVFAGPAGPAGPTTIALPVEDGTGETFVRSVHVDAVFNAEVGTAISNFDLSITPPE